MNEFHSRHTAIDAVNGETNLQLLNIPEQEQKWLHGGRSPEEMSQFVERWKNLSEERQRDFLKLVLFWDRGFHGPVFSIESAYKIASAQNSDLVRDAVFKRIWESSPGCQTIRHIATPEMVARMEAQINKNRDPDQQYQLRVQGTVPDTESPSTLVDVIVERNREGEFALTKKESARASFGDQWPKALVLVSRAIGEETHTVGIIGNGTGSLNGVGTSPFMYFPEDRRGVGRDIYRIAEEHAPPGVHIGIAVGEVGGYLRLSQDTQVYNQVKEMISQEELDRFNHAIQEAKKIHETHGSIGLSIFSEETAQNTLEERRLPGLLDALKARRKIIGREAVPTTLTDELERGLKEPILKFLRSVDKDELKERVSRLPIIRLARRYQFTELDPKVEQQEGGRLGLIVLLSKPDTDRYRLNQEKVDEFVEEVTA